MTVRLMRQLGVLTKKMREKFGKIALLHVQIVEQVFSIQEDRFESQCTQQLLMNSFRFEPLLFGLVPYLLYFILFIVASVIDLSNVTR